MTSLPSPSPVHHAIIPAGRATQRLGAEPTSVGARPAKRSIAASRNRAFIVIISQLLALEPVKPPIARKSFNHGVLASDDQRCSRPFLPHRRRSQVGTGLD